MTEKILFNRWSRERINQGRKFATSRTRKWADSRVVMVLRLPLWFVRDFLWQVEGADSPEEFEKVWRSIFRGRFDKDKIVFTHFGDFRGGD